MSDLGQNIKKFVSRGVEAIGNTASNLASNTRQKINTINLQNQKKELLEQLGTKAYSCWKNGGAFPEELKGIFLEILEIDELLQNGKKTDSPAVPSEINESPEPSEPEDTKVDHTEDQPEDHSETDTPVSCPQEDEKVTAAQESNEAEKESVDTVTEEPEQKPADKSVSPLSSAINALFDDIPPVDKMADKVNSSLDEMGEQIRKFSSELSRQITDFADGLVGKNNKE